MELVSSHPELCYAWSADTSMAESGLFLPARLRNARKQPAESTFPETNPAHTEPAHICPAPTTEFAPIVLLGRKLRRSLRLDDQ